MASRDRDDDDHDDRDDREPRPRRPDRDNDDDRPPRRRRREREYDDEDYDPRPALPPDQLVGNEIGLVLGIVGLVCGSVSLSFSFIPCFGMWALWPAVISAVISLIGIIVSVRMKALSIAGLVISLAAVGFAVHQRMQVEQAVNDAQRVLRK